MKIEDPWGLSSEPFLKGVLNAQFFWRNICANFQYFPHPRTNIFRKYLALWDIFICVKTILRACVKNCKIMTLDLRWYYANSQYLPKVIMRYHEEIVIMLYISAWKFLLKFKYLNKYYVLLISDGIWWITTNYYPILMVL